MPTTAGPVDSETPAQSQPDILDLRTYRSDALPIRQRTVFERRLSVVGLPLAVALFVVVACVIDLPFLTNIRPDSLSSAAARDYARNGAEAFLRGNRFMLAILLSSIVLWTTGALPNYLTSLIIIAALVLTHVLPEQTAYAQLGHPVMWLNIMSFVLASMLVSTGVAKRFALWFMLRFGKRAHSVFLSFLAINLALSAFVSATTAKAAILLPIFMVVAAIYGARPNSEHTNFGRAVVLQNLFDISVGASAFMTGSGANLLAVSLIAGATGKGIFYTDWLVAMMPTAVILMFLGYVFATRVFFRLSASEQAPQVAGGIDRLQAEYAKLGKVSVREIKAIALFVVILALWATDRVHGISATLVAFGGGIVALLPRVGIVEWNDVDIPWHLMLFSAGAYALGAGLDATDLPNIGVHALIRAMGIEDTPHFAVVFLTLTGAMLFSALIFESKTMRALIFVPISIGVARRFGYPVTSLALPVAFLIEHVYVLPFNSKPAALLFETNQYSLTDAARYGLTMMIVSWVVLVVASETWFRYLGITPAGVFGLF